MFKKEQLDILERLVDTFGNKQINICIEEMSELTKELCKHNRGHYNLDKIYEEMADVYIMLEQMKILFNVDENYLQEEINYKINRTKELLFK